MEDKVQDLEKRWAVVQENALKQPSPGILHCEHWYLMLECFIIYPYMFKVILYLMLKVPHGVALTDTSLFSNFSKFSKFRYIR